ncbi:GNAT family N-acetyltransferase [Stappia sp. BW2]|uniref:GNAT family N-acetyltransferase n=1 Tax=Stappia sp. BW2 TaxID=2592622 RepID=UPI0011DEC986|nr:GNAT family N-acetyltransferase [Stappia sp. BW2]TYC66756.1 GNAT family N-acetyltransferase [Stappia sp. BW2]
MSYQIVDCRSFDAAQLCDALNLAFSDYVTPMHLSVEDFREFQRQRGFSAEHSFVALAQDEIAAFWFSGQPHPEYGNRAYTLSVGTSPEHRRNGLSRQLLEAVIEKQRKEGSKGLQLEVITTNERAVSAYEAFGFHRERTLGVFRLGGTGVLAAKGRDWTAAKIGLDALPHDTSAFFDTLPTPQNSLAALRGLSPDIHLVAVCRADNLLGWGASFADGAVAQIAVHKDHRRKGIGAALLKAIMEAAGKSELRFVNVDAATQSANAFLRQAGAEELLQQYEMQLGF